MGGMKIKQNIKVLLLIGLIIGSVSLANIASTDSLDESNYPINIMSEGNEEVTIKEITREQYVENLAKNEGITINEADRQVSERTEKALEEIRKSPEMQGENVKAAGNITWRQASWVQSYSKNTALKAEMDASFEIYTNLSFRQINSCTVGSSLAAGKYTCSWKQSNSWKTTKYPVSAATVGVTGKFYTKVTQTGTGGVSLPGFTFSGFSATTKTYVSNSMTIQKQYRVY